MKIVPDDLKRKLAGTLIVQTLGLVLPNNHPLRKLFQLQQSSKVGSRRCTGLQSVNKVEIDFLQRPLHGEDIEKVGMSFFVKLLR